jgi:hypothetical protein
VDYKTLRDPKWFKDLPLPRYCSFADWLERHAETTRPGLIDLTAQKAYEFDVSVLVRCIETALRPYVRASTPARASLATPPSDPHSARSSSLPFVIDLPEIIVDDESALQLIEKLPPGLVRSEC